MRNLTLLKALRPAPEPEPDVIDDDTHGVSNYDLLLRYAVIGIFVMMATAALSFTREISMPVVAGVVFGIVLGPVADRLNRLGSPQELSAAVVVLVGMLIGVAFIAIFAAPIALWSNELPGMISTLKSKLSGLITLSKQLETVTSGIAPESAPKVESPVGVRCWKLPGRRHRHWAVD